MNKDEKMVAEEIVRNIVNGNVKEQFLNGDNDFRKNLVLALIDAEIKKLEKLHATLYTNKDFRETFLKTVLAIL